MATRDSLWLSSTIMQRMGMNQHALHYVSQEGFWFLMALGIRPYALCMLSKGFPTEMLSKLFPVSSH